MKKKTIIFMALACGVAVSTLFVSAPITRASPSDQQASGMNDGIMLMIQSPEVPQRMTFADQTIDFDRADIYEKMDRELTAMAYTHGTTMLMIKRANRYFPVLAPILKKQGVPQDLLYLAAIESVLNPRAYSPAKAAGLWQFMPGTAKQYGLEVNDEVDERYDPVKSTAAACIYLRKAYAKYGNWETVAASYNGGTNRISTELAKQQVDNTFDLHLAEETTRYPFRILAAKLIMENPGQYGFNLRADQLYQPYDCETVEVNGPVSDWPTWAKEHGITYAQLREVNPWIRAKTLTNKTGKSYQVLVPKKNSWYRSKQKLKTYNPAWVNR
ncbi:MAG: lytic transglycosylase domain-containing protein [Muribaculaceae bacterium]|nr:lytic transglycosylase domain-containing protein [Muribaculaceae bacterium]